MAFASTSRPSSPALSAKQRTLSSSGLFRSASPTHPIHIEHRIPNHPHLHIHTIRSSPIITSIPGDDETAIYDDDLSPPSSISAQVLAPFLNGPVPSSSFKPPSASSNSPGQNPTVPGANGHANRRAAARANALGAMTRSGSVSRSRERRPRMSNEDNLLTVQFLDLLGDGRKLTPDIREKIRLLANEYGVPAQLRKYVWPMLLREWAKDDERCSSLGEKEEIDAETEEKLRKIAKRIRGELSRYHRRKNKRALPVSSTVTPLGNAVPSTTPPGEPSVLSTASSTTSTPSTSPPHSLFLDAAPLDLAVESTIISFLTANPDIEYSPGMVYLANTLATYIYSSIAVSSTSNNTISGFDDPNLLLRDSFHGALLLFGQLPSKVNLIRTPSTRQNSIGSLFSLLPSTEAAKFAATHRISQFLSAFRLAMPELASYFDDEGVGGWGDDWVGGWVGWFCAKELCGKVNDEVKARLWDVYFSFPPPRNTPPAFPPDMAEFPADVAVGEGTSGPGEELHVYVCIALLKSCADVLEVLEQSEIRTLLQQLPPVEDVEAILKEARRIKEKVLLIEKEDEEAGYLARHASGGSRAGSEKSV